MNNSRYLKDFVVAGAACLALAAPAANAAMFLQLDQANIKGESLVDPYREWIEVESFSWGLTRPAASSMTGARASAKLCASEIAIQKVFDKSSPAIMTNMVGGKVLPKVKLAFTRNNGDAAPFEYLTIELTNVLITSYQVSGASDERPSDSLSLNFTTAKITYTLQGDTGKGGTPVISTVQDNC